MLHQFFFSYYYHVPNIGCCILLSFPVSIFRQFFTSSIPNIFIFHTRLYIPTCLSAYLLWHIVKLDLFFSFPFGFRVYIVWGTSGDMVQGKFIKRKYNTTNRHLMKWKNFFLSKSKAPWKWEQDNFVQDKWYRFVFICGVERIEIIYDNNNDDNGWF